MAGSVLLMGAWFAGQAAALGSPPVITAAPVLNVINAAATDAGYSACASAAASVDSCSSALGGLDDLSNSRIAQCLCCSGSSWSPDDFGDSAETCASWIKTELPGSSSEYSAYSVLGDFCVDEGNVCSGSATATATATRTRTADGSTTAAPSECYLLLDIVSSCALSNTDILNAPIKTQADCYCYTSDSQTTSWVPDVFDGYASDCATWASTADTTNFAGWSSLATFCSSVGDVVAETTTSTRIVRTTSSALTATQTSQTGQTSSHTTSTTSSATAVTVTVSPTTTSVNAAGATYGQESASFGVAGLVMAVFSYFL